MRGVVDMTMFTKYATVEFALDGSNDRVTVSNLPVTYGQGENPDMIAATKGAQWLRDNNEVSDLTLVSVCLSPR